MHSQPNKKLTTRVNCFPFMIHKFSNWKFVCLLLMWTLGSTAGADQRAGNCHQPPTLLFAPAVEQRVLSHNTGKLRLQIKPIVGIYKSLPDTWMHKLGTRPAQFSFLGIFVSIFGTVQLWRHLLAHANLRCVTSSHYKSDSGSWGWQQHRHLGCSSHHSPQPPQPKVFSTNVRWLVSLQ